MSETASPLDPSSSRAPSSRNGTPSIPAPGATLRDSLDASIGEDTFRELALVGLDRARVLDLLCDPIPRILTPFGFPESGPPSHPPVLQTNTLRADLDRMFKGLEARGIREFTAYLVGLGEPAGIRPEIAMLGAGGDPRTLAALLAPQPLHYEPVELPNLLVSQLARSVKAPAEWTIRVIGVDVNSEAIHQAGPAFGRDWAKDTPCAVKMTLTPHAVDAIDEPALRRVREQQGEGRPADLISFRAAAYGMHLIGGGQIPALFSPVPSPMPYQDARALLRVQLSARALFRALAKEGAGELSTRYLNEPHHHLGNASAPASHAIVPGFLNITTLRYPGTRVVPLSEFDSGRVFRDPMSLGNQATGINIVYNPHAFVSLDVLGMETASPTLTSTTVDGNLRDLDRKLELIDRAIKEVPAASDSEMLRFLGRYRDSLLATRAGLLEE